MNGIGIISVFALFFSAAAQGLFASSAFQGFLYPGKNLDASVTLRFGRSEPSAERFYRGLGELVPYFVVLDRNLRGTSPSNHLFIVVDETTVEILKGGVSLVKLPWTATNFSFIKEQVSATVGASAASGTTNILFSLQVAFIPAGKDPQGELKRWRRKLPKDLASGIEIRGDLFGAPLWLHVRSDGSQGVRYGLFSDFKEALTAAERLGFPGTAAEDHEGRRQHDRLSSGGNEFRREESGRMQVAEVHSNQEDTSGGNEFRREESGRMPGTEVHSNREDSSWGSVQVVPVVLDRITIGSMFGRPEK